VSEIGEKGRRKEEGWCVWAKERRKWRGCGAATENREGRCKKREGKGKEKKGEGLLDVYERGGDLGGPHESRGKDKEMCNITKMPSSLTKYNIVKWAIMVTHGLDLKDIILLLFFSLFLAYHLQAHRIK
jgi:hypothetical protein